MTSRLCPKNCVCVKSVVFWASYAGLVHCSGSLPAMCRISFGLTGVYFDPLEPNRPREEFSQPLIASIPPVAPSKPRDAVAEAVDGKPIQENVLIATKDPKNGQGGTTDDLSNSSSSSSTYGEDFPLAKKAKTNNACFGNKRVQNPVQTSSSSSSSASSSSPPRPSSDEGQIQKSPNSEFCLQAPKSSKSINPRTTQKRGNKLFKRHTSTSPGELTKAPPTKKVRFAMDGRENIRPSDDDDAGGTSSSHSSDDSYTDPPSPIEPFDAFGGCYRTRGASRSHYRNGQIAGGGMQIPVEDDYDGFLDSEEGSEIDIQGLPVKTHLPRTKRTAAKGQGSDQHHQHHVTSLARSKHAGKVMAGGLQSITDSGPQVVKWCDTRKSNILSPQSGEQLHYPKLQSGKTPPEPIFAVRPRFLSDAKDKRKSANILGRSGYTKRISEIGQLGTKSSPLSPAEVKAPKRNRPSKYRPPSVSDDVKRESKFDKDLGMLIRDV